MSGDLPAQALPDQPAAAIDPHRKRVDAHMRSTQAVNGYHLQASDGITGHVCDFMMDDKSWAIRELVVKTGHRFSGKEVQLPTSSVERISYKDSTVFVSLTKAAVEHGDARESAPAGAVG
jgi:hypothetical protein